tara:strand:+ start:254 stop:457 length:204 start_codon:yes stop_codon:yes gene_type:complete
MKHYKTVILRSTSGSKINIPRDIWSELGWKINDKLEIKFTYQDWSDENGNWNENAKPSGLIVGLSER